MPVTKRLRVGGHTENYPAGTAGAGTANTLLVRELVEEMGLTPGAWRVSVADPEDLGAMTLNFRETESALSVTDKEFPIDGGWDRLVGAAYSPSVPPWRILTVKAGSPSPSRIYVWGPWGAMLLAVESP